MFIHLELWHEDARLLKILVEEKALVKLLRTTGQGKGYLT